MALLAFLLAAWLMVASILVVVVLTAGAQYVQLFYRKHWRGTAGLPDPCFYVDRLAPEGAVARVFVHSTRPFSVSVRHAVRPDAPEWVSEYLPPQPRLPAYDFWRGFRWDHAVEVPLQGLDDGAHIVEVVQPDGSGRFLGALFLRRKSAPVVVVASTDTWHAYNDFAGLSNYRMPAVPQPLALLLKLLKAMNIKLRLTDRVSAPVIPLPLHRPLACIDEDLKGNGISHLLRAELALLRGLEAQGVTYAVAVDGELETGAFLAEPPKLIIFAAHSEYWTEPGMAALSARILAGGSVAFLSGNNLYRRIVRAADHVAVVDQTLDVDRTAGLIGAAYDAEGYLTFAGYRAVRPDHWLLAGTGLSVGDTFGAGASGYETDKMRRRSAAGSVMVAVGENAEGPGHLVCRELAGGGFVVNAGSVAFTSALESDVVLERILGNILKRAME